MRLFSQCVEFNRQFTAILRIKCRLFSMSDYFADIGNMVKES